MPFLTSPATASTPSTTARSTPWNRFILVLGSLVLLALVFLAALLLSFRMGGETRALRNAVFDVASDEWTPRVEFGVGRLPAFLARSGFRLAEPFLPGEVPPEAGATLGAFRSADIGIYRRTDPNAVANDGMALSRAESVMQARGWEPLVSVQDHGESVRIYVPRALDSHQDLRVAVFVMQPDQLVIVSARIDAEPLVRLLQRHLPHHRLLSGA